jgi:hypothetical protein
MLRAGARILCERQAFCPVHPSAVHPDTRFARLGEDRIAYFVIGRPACSGLDGVRRGRARGEGAEVVTHAEGRGLEARVHLELGQDALDVGPHGVAADAQAACDGPTVCSLHEEPEHFSFARRELSHEERDAVGRPATMTTWDEPMRNDHLPLDDGFQRADEPGHGRVLREIPSEPRPKSVIDRSGVVECGDGQELRLRPSVQDLLTDRESAAVGKPEIHQDHVGTFGLEERDRVPSVDHRSAHAHPSVLKRSPDRLGEQDVIIHDQDANRCGPLPSTGNSIWKLARGLDPPTPCPRPLRPLFE